MNKKINIAICLSGLCDNYELGIENINTFKTWSSENINIDIFIHTWSSPNVKKYINLYNPTSYNIESKDTLDNIITFFAKKHIAFRDSLDSNFIKKIKDTNHTCLSQFYSMSECHKLRNSFNKNYDFVIRSRCDLVIEGFINNVEYVLHKLAKHDKHNKKNCTNILYVPWIRSDEKGNTHTDWCIMLARPYVFDKIFDLFPLCLENVPKLDGSEHSIMYNHLVSRNIRVCCNIPVKYSIKRG